MEIAAKYSIGLFLNPALLEQITDYSEAFAFEFKQVKLPNRTQPTSSSTSRTKQYLIKRNLEMEDAEGEK